jgi:hypothetical protein
MTIQQLADDCTDEIWVNVAFYTPKGRMHLNNIIYKYLKKARRMR